LVLQRDFALETTIVVHATANSTLIGVVSWFQNPTSYVSAHYVIGKDGKDVAAG
jgi:N-acetyl-anhydromuramyl-L-alanine amidase AmpD